LSLDQSQLRLIKPSAPALELNQHRPRTALAAVEIDSAIVRLAVAVAGGLVGSAKALRADHHLISADPLEVESGLASLADLSRAVRKYIG
jgi:hypothetical protein